MATRTGYEPTQRAWTKAGSDDAWLALDWNKDGVINNFSELFGNATPQRDPGEGEVRNGFIALEEFDVNGDQEIDANDWVFTELRLWQDKDHDGVSQAEELHSLTELGVAGLSIAYIESRRADEHGNLYRFTAAVRGTPGSKVGQEAWDIWLVGVQSKPMVSSGLTPAELDDATTNAYYAYRCRATCSQKPKPPWAESACQPDEITVLGIDGATRADGCFVAKLLCEAYLITDAAKCEIDTNTCNTLLHCTRYLRPDPGEC